MSQPPALPSPPPRPSALSSPAIDRAVRLSYAQAMLGSVYVASTGGMFIVGYALKLGADYVQLGLMSSIPMLCVLAQLAASIIVERGVSRRRMTLAASLLNVAGWALIILIPYVAAGASANVQVWSLIAIVTVVTLFGHVAGNARGSWLGDLVPAGYRGTFFGRMMMYGGIVGTVFAVLEGTFLDHVKGMGIGSFSWLFGFGMFFGLANALLFVPQPDLPLEEDPARPSFTDRVRQTFSNRPLMIVMVYAMLWSMQLVAGPFYAAYLLNDLGMGFLPLGLLNSAVTFSMLAFSPFWGRMVDRYGCRPVLIACTTILAPLPLVWLGLTDVHTIYWVIPPVNVVAGFTVAGVSVALNTLVYNVTPSAGRSVQFAIYSVLVVLAAAPMPALGGCLPEWLRSLGLAADLRCTFYASAGFVALAALAARCIPEPGSRTPGQLLRNLPRHLAGRPAPGAEAKAE